MTRDGDLLGLAELHTVDEDGFGPTGVAIDAAGKVWVTCYRSHTAKRVDSATRQVDLTVDLEGDSHPLRRAGPYNYSDMTGAVALGALKFGMWTDVYDSGITDPENPPRWTLVTWNDEPGCPAQPSGTEIRVQVRAVHSPTELGVTREPFREVENGVPILPGFEGRFVQSRRKTGGEPAESPPPDAQNSEANDDISLHYCFCFLLRIVVWICMQELLQGVLGYFGGFRIAPITPKPV